MDYINFDKIELPKKKQLILSIETAILNRRLKRGDKLPSINRIRNKFSISRDTILSAYNELKIRGIIQAIAGKGYYLIKESKDTSHRIFLFFDEFNGFKESLYNSFITNLNSGVEVDIFFHHFDYEVFRETIVRNIGNYSYYIIMPANLKNTGLVIDYLPPKKVYLLDQIHDDLKKFPSIYQNFRRGVYDCLMELKEKLMDYSKLVLIFNSKKEPMDILEAVQAFCSDNNFPVEVLESIKGVDIRKANVYMTLEDSSLINILKQAKLKGLKIGCDIGILAYNDSLLKEIIEGGITVISTDFKEMGEKLAEMLKKKLKDKIAIRISLTLRKSL